MLNREHQLIRCINVVLINISTSSYLKTTWTYLGQLSNGDFNDVINIILSMICSTNKNAGWLVLLSLCTRQSCTGRVSTYYDYSPKSLSHSPTQPAYPELAGLGSGPCRLSPARFGRTTTYNKCVP